MRISADRSPRRGAILAEAAIVIVVFLTLVLGTIDLGLGVLRNNTISHAARHGARQAIVRGQLAPASMRAGWGPATVNVTASTAGDPVADAIRPMLTGCDLDATQISVEWPQGNLVESPARVTITTPYTPIMTFIFGSPTITLRASSTMPIAH